MKIRFLLDENLSPKLKIAVQRINSTIDILRVGDADAPLLGTLDPNLLQYLELSQRLLITDNRSTMPNHLKDHWNTGGHTWGIIWLRPSGTISQWAESMILIWELTEAEEWIDRLDWIPL
ncbi:MAG: DUF5615 family PIN-like protein [Microcystis sp.]|jgi:hypothetical protein|uniref:Uncharacterized protein n=4 Tax=Microcystaceae TaxID=1890449 RepID=B0JNE9_MICAN|nr:MULTISPECIES: DUF5615 family PIN-like protein [Microcystis]MCE2664912.1 DUF5615 family PIN-like protein [Microcystis sp. 53602_E8]MCZ8361950.1 DUF5615 family PIN-like protein [Microcystis sp. LE19-251.1A]MDJ0527965.1 DUF5615 family PIN-like protein [Microcystis sp. M53600_WE12]MDJ0546197.1 DUF5615 family PIN-like protein [Microcystis sp. M53601_WE4]MDJ0547615.1 DUF5615 family PIN-like protein [Microcystis sp. M49637_WE12]MDJ0563382.1 DUF5615 family PIN-like protein [Microcystis sp. M49629_